MFNKDNRFDLDLAKAEIREKELRDIIGKYKLEIKTDSIWKKSGRLAVEFKSRGKPSGISTTQAEYHAFILDANGFTEGIIFIPTEKLKILAKYHYQQGNIVNGGENSDMVLVPIADLVK
jgi:hypothetical protein